MQGRGARGGNRATYKGFARRESHFSRLRVRHRSTDHFGTARAAASTAAAVFRGKAALFGQFQQAARRG